ncbi:MAG: formylglycine-generating enzyme family protein [Pseudomonadota bacterium]
MGSPLEEGERWEREDDETVHEVTLMRPFLLGRTPVTRAQYLEVMGDDPSFFNRPEFSSYVGSDCPMDSVTWYDAIAFCNRLSEGEGLAPCYAGGNGAGIVWNQDAEGYRLPTEAEWEYACRAGTRGPAYGDLREIAWYRDNADWSSHPVGQRRPNAWGLCDMLGNVWEWCWDWWAGFSEEAVTDPAGPPRGVSRVLRGGSWRVRPPFGPRAAQRGAREPEVGELDVGFRLARSVRGLRLG